MKKLIALLSVILVSVFTGVGFGAVLHVSPLIPGTISFIASFIPIHLETGCLYQLMYTSPAVAGTYQFQATYLPEFFTWDDAGAAITQFTIETAEDGVLANYNAAAMAALNGYQMVGAQAANQFTLRVGNGRIEDKNVTVTLTTAAAAAIAFFGWSDTFGSIPYLLKNAAIQALNPTDFSKFLAVFIPALVAATSRVTIEFADNLKQILAVADLLSMSTYYQQVPGVVINNFSGYIHKATVESVAAVASYVLSYKIPGQD